MKKNIGVLSYLNEGNVLKNKYDLIRKKTTSVWSLTNYKNKTSIALISQHPKGRHSFDREKCEPFFLHFSFFVFKFVISDITRLLFFLLQISIIPQPEEAHVRWKLISTVVCESREQWDRISRLLHFQYTYSS